MVLLGFCKDCTWSSAGIVQGVHLEAARISLGDLQGFCNSSFGFCKGFTWIVQGCHFEFGRDFARRSLGVCSCFTWTLQGRCKDFAWSSAGILQGVSLDCAMSLLGVCKELLTVCLKCLQLLTKLVIFLRTPGTWFKIVLAATLCRNCVLKSG